MQDSLTLQKFSGFSILTLPHTTTLQYTVPNTCLWWGDALIVAFASFLPWPISSYRTSLTAESRRMNGYILIIEGTIGSRLAVPAGSSIQLSPTCPLDFPSPTQFFQNPLP